jgi:F-type H+-transporting ATPase subunit delta
MLPALEGYVAALLGSLDRDALSAVADDLSTLEQTVLSRSDLRAVLSDTSITGAARGLVVRDLLRDKIGDVAQRLAVYAATYAPAQEVPQAIGEVAYLARILVDTGVLEQASLALMAARHRVGGFADALLDGLDTGVFARIEEELFRWARSVEASQELRRLLLDRDAPLSARVGATTQLLEGRVHPVTLRLATYVIEGGRPRDVVGTLDFLVDYVARARGWRVARVFSARALDASSADDLVASLTTLTGRPVELQVAEEPELLGGVLVEVGDLRLDATTRGRLGALRDSVAAGHLFESTLSRND